MNDLLSYVDWLFWLIAIIVFLVMEVATINLISIWFAIGSLVALIASLFGVNPYIQIVLFIVVSLISIIIFLVFIKPKWNRKIKLSEKTNADRILQQEAVVIQRINPLANTGQIRVKGQIWSASTKNDQVIETDTLVRVVEIKGVKAIVEPLT